MSTAFWLWVGLAFGNFAWQALRERRWAQAAEVSWFQAVAVAISYFTFRS